MSIARQRSTSIVVGAIAAVAAVFAGLAGGPWLFSAALLMVVGIYLRWLESCGGGRWSGSNRDRAFESSRWLRRVMNRARLHGNDAESRRPPRTGRRLAAVRRRLRLS